MAKENSIYEIAKHLLEKRGINKYDIQPEIITANPASVMTIFTNGDLYLFVNAFSDEPVDAKIVSQDAALRLSAKTINSNIYKHKMFQKPIEIQNFNQNEDVVIEFLRITPFE
jgi:hypothetical protein